MSRFQGRERARGETFIVFRRRRGGVRFGREEIWEAEPANLNSKYQISYPLIFVLVSLDLTSRHVSILRNMLESGRGLSSYHFPDQTLARRVTSKRYSASGGSGHFPKNICHFRLTKHRATSILLLVISHLVFFYCPIIFFDLISLPLLITYFLANI